MDEYENREMNTGPDTSQDTRFAGGPDMGQNMHFTSGPDTSFRPLSAGESYNKIGKSLFFLALVSQLAAVGLLVILWLIRLAFPQFGHSSFTLYFLNFAPIYLVGMPICYKLMQPVAVSKPVEKRLSLGDWMIGLLICLPLMEIGGLIGTVLSLIFSAGRAQNPVDSLMTDNVGLEILFVVIIGPCLEEFFFRQQLIDRLGRFGEKAAIVFSALAFGLFHMNLYQFFYAFAVGLVFGYIYTRTHRLRYTILMHMAINLLSGILAPAILSALLSGILGLQIVALLFSCLYFALMVTGFVFLFTYGRHFKLMPAPAQIPREYEKRTVYGAPWVIAFMILCVALMIAQIVLA